MLAPADRDKLAKLIRLLASDQPGEVVAAGAAITRLLQSRGLDADQLLAPAGSAAQPHPQPQADDGAADPISLARFILDHPLFPVLSEKTQAFVRVIATGWTGTVSPAQREWLQNAADRVRRGGAPSERQQRTRRRRAA